MVRAMSTSIPEDRVTLKSRDKYQTNLASNSQDLFSRQDYFSTYMVQMSAMQIPCPLNVILRGVIPKSQLIFNPSNLVDSGSPLNGFPPEPRRHSRKSDRDASAFELMHQTVLDIHRRIFRSPACARRPASGVREAGSSAAE
ncbi:hypothetical protein RSAG8_10132, partial [Rhizoctonia solani AG-8 WAC10335]